MSARQGKNSVPNPFEDDEPTTWAPIDIGPVARGEITEPPPTILARRDGLCLLYPGKVHAINSESEAGKTWMALHACSERMLQGEHVIFIDFEDSATGVVGRLCALGLEPELIDRAFHYIRPDEPISPRALSEIADVAEENCPTLIILDGVTEAMVLHGWSIENNNDVAQFMKTIVRKLQRMGSALLLLDHLPKDRTSQGRYAIGAQHKLSGVDGAVYKMEIIKPFGRGLIGESRLLVMKDRPGYIRANCLEGKHVGVFVVQSDDDGTVTLELVPPREAGVDNGVGSDEGFLHEIRVVVEETGDWVTTTEVREKVIGSNQKIRSGLNELVKLGSLERRERGKAILYRAVKPSRVKGDPDG